MSDDQAIVVVASAGSGKTEVAARRVERLLSKSPDSAFRILALSYTVKAADELRERFSTRLGDLHRRVDTTTVHGFAHDLLRQHGTRIGLPVEPEILTRDEDRAELLSRWLKAEGSTVPDDLLAVFRALDLARARLQSAPFLNEWNEALASAGALDYASMLLRAIDLLELPSARRQLARLYGHVIVDEAQNLTAAQYALLTALIGPLNDGQHVPAVLIGDDKQSIVSFAGADPLLIARFSNEYQATRFELHQNFRSAAQIVTLGEVVATELGHLRGESHHVDYAAKGLVEHHEAADEDDEGRFVATWISTLLKRGIPTEALAPGETSHVSQDDVAVLARSAAALRATQSALEAEGYQPAMSSSSEDWLSTLAGKVAYEVVALMSAGSHRSTHWQLARLMGVDEADVRSPADVAEGLRTHPDITLKALIPLCGVDKPTDFIASLAGLEMPEYGSGQPLAAWEADCRQLIDAWRGFVQKTDRAEQSWGNFRIHVSRLQRGDDLHPGVRLLTIHKAQGREYRAVVVVGLNDGQMPDFRASTQDERISELRTFYVAVTRPARMLLLTRAKSRQTRYGSRITDPSPYLRFLPDAH